MLIKVAVMNTVKIAPGQINPDEELLISKEISAKDEITAILLVGAERGPEITERAKTHSFRVITQKIG